MLQRPRWRPAAPVAAAGGGGGSCHRFFTRPSLFLFVLLSVATARSQSPVYVLNEHSQLVTSSTLQWVTAEDGGRPNLSVMGGTDASEMRPGGTDASGPLPGVTDASRTRPGVIGLHVCRGAQRGGGHFYAGALRPEGCVAVAGGKVCIISIIIMGSFLHLKALKQ